MKLIDEQIKHIRNTCPVGLELRREPAAETGSIFSRAIDAAYPGVTFVTSYANGFAFGEDVAAFAGKDNALLTVLTLRSVPDLCDEVLALRKQVALDAESRKASQAEFARLNRELNEARVAKDDAVYKIGALLHEIAHTAIARGLMREDAPPLDGPNAILFLQMMRES